MAWRLIEHLKPGGARKEHLCGTEIENLSLMKCVSSNKGDCCTKSVKTSDGKKDKPKETLFPMDLCPPRSFTASKSETEFSFFETSFEKSEHDFAVTSLDESKRRLLKSLQEPTGSNLQIPWINKDNNKNANTPTPTTTTSSSLKNSYTNLNYVELRRSNPNFEKLPNVNPQQLAVLRDELENEIRSLEMPTAQPSVEIPWIVINGDQNAEINTTSSSVSKTKKRRNSHITIEEEQNDEESMISTVSSFEEGACSNSFSFKKRRTAPFSDPDSSYFNVSLLMSDLSTL